MFIRVKYGDDETLLCNPSCVVVNLLASIKNRTGHSHNEIVVDLTDETGLVQELDSHRYDCAADYLSAPGTYVLVRKQAVDGDDAAADFEYIPLLNNCDSLLPGYQVQRTGRGGAKESRGRKSAVGNNRHKSQSPAGAKHTRAKQSRDRATSRKR